jgi:hypothetical protein
MSLLVHLQLFLRDYHGWSDYWQESSHTSVPLETNLLRNGPGGWEEIQDATRRTLSLVKLPPDTTVPMTELVWRIGWDVLMRETGDPPDTSRHPMESLCPALRALHPIPPHHHSVGESHLFEGAAVRE